MLMVSGLLAIVDQICAPWWTDLLPPFLHQETNTRYRVGTHAPSWTELELQLQSSFFLFRLKAIGWACAGCQEVISK